MLARVLPNFLRNFSNRFLWCLINLFSCLHLRTISGCAIFRLVFVMDASSHLSFGRMIILISWFWSRWEYVTIKFHTCNSCTISYVVNTTVINIGEWSQRFSANVINCWNYFLVKLFAYSSCIMTYSNGLFFNDSRSLLNNNISCSFMVSLGASCDRVSLSAILFILSGAFSSSILMFSQVTPLTVFVLVTLNFLLSGQLIFFWYDLRDLWDF